MLRAIVTLLGLQLIGEILARTLHLPIPGPVVGMLLLFAALQLRRKPPAWLTETGDGLLGHLGLLFVPAGVGVVTHAGLLSGAWLPILLTLLISTGATLAATALLLSWLMRGAAQPGGGHD